jgi:hypothetical protein
MMAKSSIGLLYKLPLCGIAFFVMALIWDFRYPLQRTPK